MSYTVNSSSVEAENDTRQALSQSEDNEKSGLRNATSEGAKSKVLRNATAKQDYIQELRQRVTAAYSEAELQGILEREFQILTRADNGNPDIVEVPLEVLGYDTEARELNYSYVVDLALTNERMWPPLEVCLWPAYLPIAVR